MRPQYNRRVQRALATLGVMVLGGGVVRRRRQRVADHGSRRHPSSAIPTRAPRAPCASVHHTPPHGACSCTR